MILGLIAEWLLIVGGGIAVIGGLIGLTIIVLIEMEPEKRRDMYIGVGITLGTLLLCALAQYRLDHLNQKGHHEEISTPKSPNAHPSSLDRSPGSGD